MKLLKALAITTTLMVALSGCSNTAKTRTYINPYGGNDLVKTTMTMNTKLSTKITKEQEEQSKALAEGNKDITIEKVGDNSYLVTKGAIVVTEEVKFKEGKVVKYRSSYPNGDTTVSTSIDFEKNILMATQPDGSVTTSENTYKAEDIPNDKTILLNIYKEPQNIDRYMEEKDNILSYSGNNDIVIFALTRISNLAQGATEKAKFTASYEYELNGAIKSVKQTFKDTQGQDTLESSADLIVEVTQDELEIEDKSNIINIDKKNAEDIKVVK